MIESILSKLSEVSERYVEIENLLSQPDITTNQVFNVSEEYTEFILKNNIPGIPATPIKINFDCPSKDCFSKRKIENLRVEAKVIGTSKSALIKINNWSAYVQ